MLHRLVFAFSKEISILLYGGGPLVYLNLGFSASVTLEMALVSNKEILVSYILHRFRLVCITFSWLGQVLDSKGIREAVQEKKPIKALNSFAIRDVIDGVDSPLIRMEAGVTASIEVR